jgi:N-carbamoylputrescine amidase
LSELSDGIRMAAEAGARAVFLPELTLSRYPADSRAVGTPKEAAEDLLAGPTFAFAASQAARHGVAVHASLFERPAADDGPSDPRGYNTAILVGADGRLAGRTRKMHIPVTAGYYEDTYFRPGPASSAAAPSASTSIGDPTSSAGASHNAYPVYTVPELGGARVGLPTCWDQWFPEVARAYGLGGAEVRDYVTTVLANVVDQACSM